MASATFWQDRFDGTAADIFELQDEVAARVAGASEPRLQHAEALIEGLEILRRALELDPGYTNAQAQVCYAHNSAFATRWWTFQQAQAAMPHARKVLDSGTDDALALACAGHYMAYIGRGYHEGLTALKRAAALNPNSGTIQMLLGWVYNYLNDAAPAIEHLERAKRLSPLHPHIGVINSGIGTTYALAGDDETAVRHFEQAMTEYPEFASNQMMLMGVYWARGRKGDAARMAEWLRHKVPDMTVQTFLDTRPQHSEDYRDLMVEALGGIGFPG